MDPLDYLTQPVYQSASLFLLGIFSLCLRRYRVAAALMAVAVLWLALCATPAFSDWLQRGVEARYPLQNAAAYPTADVIVVLGGGVLPGPSDSPAESAAARGTRAGFGLALYRHARAPLMLVSGGEQEAVQMAHMLRQQGVPAPALLTEEVSMNTHQNAVYCAAILRRRNLQRILLVTSPLHMPRAVASFRQEGFTVIPAPTPDVTVTAESGQPPPQRGSALTRTSRCLREYFGLWLYRLRGWA